MSLTNPNKPVTEARLQEFYHRIKSYLGFTEMPSEDMSEVISPLPSVQPRYHKYSTEEHIVGEWIDGSTIYEKTIDCGALPNANRKEIPHGISNIGYIISAIGYGSTANRQIQLPLPFSHPSSVQENIAVGTTATSITIVTGIDRTSLTISYVTLQYTKSE